MPGAAAVGPHRSGAKGEKWGVRPELPVDSSPSGSPPPNAAALAGLTTKHS